MSTQLKVEPTDDREHTRAGMSPESLRRAFLDNLFYLQGRFWDVATEHDHYMGRGLHHPRSYTREVEQDGPGLQKIREPGP